MIKENKEEYRKLCNKEVSIPIFSRDWWMDSVCGEENWAVLFVEKCGKILATLPYFLERKYGFAFITQPLLTQTNGVWIKNPDQNQKYAKRLAYEKDLMTELIDRIEELKIAYYSQNFHYSVTNWLPFFWRGYSEKTRYTYVIDNLEDLEKVYSDFETKIRTDIKKASKVVKVKENCELDRFYRINKSSYDRQDVRIPYSLKLIERIDEACKMRNCRKIFYAEDSKGRIHAACYIIWDENSSYYLMGGGDQELRNSGANSLVLWHAIQYAAAKAKKFDFEGSMVESVERFFRAFGGFQMPYFNISKSFSPLWNIAKATKNILKIK